jgi:SagB-type dehydrogenase family enzyme
VRNRPAGKRPSIDRLVCRRSSHLVCHWRGADVVIENYATATRVSAPSIACSILAFFDEWRPIDAFLASTPPETHRVLRPLLRQLVRHSLLHRSDRAVSARERAMDRWQAWNPAGGFFHSATRDVPFIDMDTNVRRLRRKGTRTPMPDPVKRFRGARLIRLPAQRARSEFAEVLLARRTWRRFGAGPIDLTAFGTLLGLTAGVQRWGSALGEGKVAFKTSPSGGARHSIELYVLALGVQGLPAGWYHYAADAHALELLRARVSTTLVKRYLPQQPWFRPARAIVFFTSVFQRELWRYEYARAYRAVLIEAGHLCQTFCLTATWLGLAPFCTMALADSAIEKDLGLDGIGESVLYAAGIGARPRGIESPVAGGRAPARRLSRAEVDRFPGRILSSG